jgi:uncharacterized membrane protein
MLMSVVPVVHRGVIIQRTDFVPWVAGTVLAALVGCWHAAVGVPCLTS